MPRPSRTLTPDATLRRVCPAALKLSSAHDHAAFRFQGQTRFGQPVRIHPLGVTEIEAPLLEAYLAGLADTFGPGKYHLLERNCNNFSNEVSEFLVGHGIPSEIVSMPQDLLNTYDRPFSISVRPSTPLTAPYACSRAAHSAGPSAS